MSQAALPNDGRPSSLCGPHIVSVNITVRTMLMVAAPIGLAWAFVSIEEVIMTVFLALFPMLDHLRLKWGRLRLQSSSRPRGGHP